MRVIFVTGPPWSGKTTQSLLLARHLGYEYCSPGDWLRIERDRDSHLGIYINQNYSLTTIDPLVTDYVAAKIREAAQLMHAGLLVDGFPRTAYQASRLPAVCVNHEFLVFAMDQVSREEATRRALIKTWTPPIGSLPTPAVEQTTTEEDYHVLTVEDTQRRYDGYESKSDEMFLELCRMREGSQRPQFLFMIDASSRRPPPLISQQIKDILRDATVTAARVVVPIEPPLLPPQPASAIETAVAIQLSMALVGRADLKRRFVGSHPVSLQRSDLATLVSQGYMVSRKWDGERLLLLLYQGRIWFLMRNYTVLRGRWDQEVAERWNETLVDCEWLSAGAAPSGAPGGTLYIIDCIAIRGPGHRRVMPLPLLQRLQACKDLLPTLRRLMHPQASKVDYQLYYAFADMRYLLTSLKTTSETTDGVVFTSPTLPYKAGRDKQLFKWKDASTNTVDLLYVGDKAGTLCVRQTAASASSSAASVDTIAMATMPLVPVGTLVGSSERRFAPNTILECLYVADGRWRCVKERTDRSEPNADWVYRRVLESLRENIRLEELCDLPGVR